MRYPPYPQILYFATPSLIPQMNTPLNSVFDRIVAWLKADLSFSLSLGYVLLISLGILFNQFYYGYFGIDALAYSELTDFLVAPIRTPMILVFFFANLLFFYVMSFFDDWFLARYPRLYRQFSLGFDPHSPGYHIYKKLSFLFVLVVYVYTSMQILAVFETRKLRQKSAPQVDLVLKAENETFTKSRHVFIGKIGNHLVVKADTSRRKAIIYPMEEIHEIRMVPQDTLPPKRK